MTLNFNGHVVSGTPEEINEFIGLNTPTTASSNANNHYVVPESKPQFIYTVVHYRINCDLDQIEDTIYNSYTDKVHAIEIADQILLRMHEADAEDCRVDNIHCDLFGLRAESVGDPNSENLYYLTFYEGVNVKGTPYCELIRVYERRLDCDE